MGGWVGPIGGGMHCGGAAYLGTNDRSHANTVSDSGKHRRFHHANAGCVDTKSSNTVSDADGGHVDTKFSGPDGDGDADAECC